MGNVTCTSPTLAHVFVRCPLFVVICANSTHAIVSGIFADNSLSIGDCFLCDLVYALILQKEIERPSIRSSVLHLASYYCK